MTARMTAVAFAEPGGPEVLKAVERERPVPGPAEVLVRVHAAGVNPVDWKTRAAGALFLPGDGVVGWDVSGVVEAVGLGVTLFRPGDEVYGMPGFPRMVGGYAEYVAAPARHFAPKPAGLDHVHAAALPLAALTAWQALVDMAALKAGQRVLVHAAAGGVGHLAVQIAKAYGAYVIGTASAGKHAFVRGLGADEVIDYTAVDFASVVSDVDVVIDPISGDYQERSLSVLRDGGTLITLSARQTEALTSAATARSIRSGFMLVEPDRRALLAITELAANGRLRAHVDAVFPLADAARAHELGETGRTTGKLVLTVDPLDRRDGFDALDGLDGLDPLDSRPPRPAG
ncbi:NADP-dependent oxidoreductase [Streptomyces mobaraensis]|uniref:NADP-dependent oxidoreductase n=1 Tax=Streptomyces mobaraensis TaxID=35621 RepID=A0A5N5WDC6_STRMB|nr:NADP-dependent oxidoreductase [Streptomyces mobaraensis]KAB7849258.1 NADP-dependent oxidoreductase [Streptomyces mobaraensis]